MGFAFGDTSGDKIMKNFHLSGNEKISKIYMKSLAKIIK